MFKNRKVLVTGGTGLIGKPLVEMLLERGAKVRIVSLDSPSRGNPQAEFMQFDLRYFDQCLKACDGVDFVFNLVGIKGSPAMTAKQPASFFVPTLQFSINMMEAARRQGVQKYLFTSSVGVYEPAEVFYEDSVWKTFPSPNDRFAGWAKRMGELQAEAYRIEHQWDDIYIVRPANVYGAWDNFDPRNAMVIPSLIKRAVDGENPMTVWGDGSAIRDFIHAKDCARGMIKVFEKGIKEPVNLASGTGVSIREIVEVLVKLINPSPEVLWDTSKPSGDHKRVLDTIRAESYGIKSEISLEEGILDTLEWYQANKEMVDNRYNAFNEKN
jgi:GDP-L-fucose synthase